MFGGFSFGAAMCDFFIIIEAFFGSMVVACGDGRGWEGNEEAASERSVREPVGQRETAGVYALQQILESVTTSLVTKFRTITESNHR
jgi:hypothetical protein